MSSLYNALSNLAIEINFTDHIKENYAISDDIIYINVKEDIDKLKAKEEIISNAPNLEIIGVNGSGAHNMNVSIKKGGSITYLISGDYFKQVLSSGNLKGTCTSKSITTTKAEYKCTYNTTLAKFTPSMKVEDTNSSVFFPQAPKVEVIEDNNNAPSITIIEDENIYTKGQKIYLKASASDDGYISSTIWETYRSELKIFNKNSIDKAYFYAPTLLQNRRIYFFKITVLDNHKRSTSKIYAIKVQGDTSIKKEIKYISDINYADTCSSFTQTNCGYKITDTSLEKITKKWKYKNTGNVDLKSIKFYTETKSDFIGTLQIGNPSSASIIRQDSDFEISVDISIPKNMIDGEYTRKWILKDNFGNNIKFSNGNIAIMFFKFKLQRGITSESLSLEDLLLGKTLYEKCENHVNTLVFQHNGKIKSIEKNDIKYIPYSIAGNILTTSDEEGEETKTLKSSSSKYIKLEENNEDITTFYFSKYDANHAPFNNDCNDEDETIVHAPKLKAISGDKEVSLSWNVIDGARYNLYYGTSTISDLASATKISNISTNAKTITSLTNDTKYYFVVTAVKDRIESVKSNEVSQTPKDFQNVDLTNGLVAHYEFEDNATDSSVNKNDGIEYGGVSYVDGVIGKAGMFGGVNDPGHIKVINSLKLQFLNEVTYTGWIKVTELIMMDGYGSTQTGEYGGGTFFAKSHDRNGVAFKYHISKNGVGSAYFQSYDNWIKNRVDYDIKFEFLKNINEWAYITVVLSSKNGKKIYLDSNLWRVSTGEVDFSEMNNENLYIGKYSDTWYPFRGAIDDFRVYNRALSRYEIIKLYQLR